MSTFRDAQNRAHPNKTNTLMLVILALLIGVVSLQIWLLTATLNASLSGDRAIVWPAFYGSLLLFVSGGALLRYLPDPLRQAPPSPAKPEPFPQAALAWRTLAISFVSLTLAFAVWFMWSAIATKINDAGFRLTKEQLFWLTASPVLLGSLLRVPFGLLVSRFGSRRSNTFVTLLLLLPCMLAGWALRTPATPYWVLLLSAALTGLAGANFATSMGAVTLWFPKKLQGTALGLNGLGNLGVTVAQFTIPVVLPLALFGMLAGSVAPGARPIHLANAAWVWLPVILACAAALWFGTQDYPAQPKTLASQLRVCRDKHTWAISYLYFLTFGAFVAMGASLPLIIKEVFVNAPGGAPNPLTFSPLAVLIATLMRPVGGVVADKLGAGRVTALAIAVMALAGFSLSHFLQPHQFTGFFVTIMILCAAAGLGNGSCFKIIPSVNAAEAGPMMGIVSCLGALGGFFPPLILAWCIGKFGSPALAYTGMAVFALTCFSVNWWFYWRNESPSRC
ncbi:MAG: MFS transporter [Verrucomicrobia bacterium]|nr:MFS transporter [Verrucomicrobiota bacterium]